MQLRPSTESATMEKASVYLIASELKPLKKNLCMSHNNDHEQKPVEVKNIEKPRPNVDIDKLKESVKQKNDAVNQNQIVRK